MSRVFMQGCALVAALCSTYALAQTPPATYPNRTMRIIVGFPPGSSNDLLARFIGTRLHERLGQPVIIDNRPGASGMIGAEIASKAAPDGHTLYLMTASHTMNPAVRKVPFDPVKGFEPIALLGVAPLVLVTHPALPANSVKEFIDLLKAKPGGVSFASAGAGGINHFGAALFLRMTGTDMVHVPYKGGAPALTDVIAGQVQVMFGTMPLSLPNVRAGRVKALGVSSLQRSPHLPQTPTISEAGVTGYTIENWWSLATTGGVSPGIVQKLNAEVAAILGQPETAKLLNAAGAAPKIVSSAELVRLVGSELERWAKVAREANITVN